MQLVLFIVTYLLGHKVQRVTLQYVLLVTFIIDEFF